MLDLAAFGEILWDVIDGVPHIGGAPFNLAAHAARCGLSAAAVSRVGNDELGRAALSEMARLRVDARWMTTDLQHPTGTVTVALSSGQPSYTIHEGAAWDFIEISPSSVEALSAERPRAFCFGTLAQREEVSRQTLGVLLDALRDAVVFYDVNLRQSYWSGPLVEAGLARAALVKVNDDEARVLGKLLFGGACEPAAFARAVIVTLGAAGCLVCERGREPVRCPGVKVDVVDAVGAGDAFSAAFLAAWLKGATAAQAAEAGNARGAWVASRRGAVPEEIVGQASPPVPNRTDVSPVSQQRTGGDACPTGEDAGETPTPLFKPFDPRGTRSTHRRHLPHWSQSGATYFVTWRLADSIPLAVLAEWREERDQWLAVHPQPWDCETEDEYWIRFAQRFDNLLGDGDGACLMKEADVALIVEQSLLHFEGDKYTLWRYVIMPNHVHVLVTPSEGVGLSAILHGWKGYTAKEINKMRGSSGAVWQDETFDHIVRTESQLAKFVRYIEDNPIKAHVKAVVGPTIPPELP